MNYLLGKTPIRNSYRDGDITEWESKMNSMKNEYEDTIKSLGEAMLIIIQNPTIAAHGGYDLDKMSDEDKIEFANQIADTIKFFGNKYNK